MKYHLAQYLCHIKVTNNRHLMENVHFEKENNILSTTSTVITTILFVGLMVLGSIFVFEAIALLNSAQYK